MDAVATSLVFTSLRICPLPGSPPSAHAPYTSSPHSLTAPISPTSAYKPLSQSPIVSPRSLPPMSSVSPYSSAINLNPRAPASPRSTCSRLSSFQGFNDFFTGGSWKMFEGVFESSLEPAAKKGPARKRSAAAHASFATGAKEQAFGVTASFGNIRKTHYSILGVLPTSTQNEIRLAYRKLALEFHPDVAPLHQMDNATRLFSQINEAYDVLSDPQRRKGYDLKLALEAPASIGIVYSAAQTYTNMATGRVYPSINSLYREWRSTCN